MRRRFPEIYRRDHADQEGRGGTSSRTARQGFESAEEYSIDALQHGHSPDSRFAFRFAQAQLAVKRTSSAHFCHTEARVTSKRDSFDLPGSTNRRPGSPSLRVPALRAKAKARNTSLRMMALSRWRTT